MDVNQDETPDSTSIVTSLDDLSSMALYQHVTVRGKVIAVEPPCLVSSKDKKELRKQECMIADLRV